ncbi:hypothetical protein F2P56_006085 [Juglans regia]|uniref:Disease resistance R13L4/SHOC-2-like LRR domain-containing protein n=2 Tax=Juglans regia TaxID=51240 RepID=A0A834CXZ6_JUGRE|nr:putative disease resistance protein RGA3 [Juglans regia]KAF5474159.1 hypothetical protein F2P56_006085 [Juglans regia]
MGLYKFKVHDLVHDLALSVAAGEFSIVDFGTKNIAGTSRLLSFSDNSPDFSMFLNNFNNRVRTIVHPIKKGISYPIKPVPIVEEFILRFNYLRALDFSNSYFEVLPTSIGTLKHLRYLSLSGNKIISKLSDTVCQLHNLQALKLLGCSKLEGLPKDITNMVNLRGGRVPRQPSEIDYIFVTLLTALEALAINDCEELCLTRGEDNQDLKMSLQKLEIFHLPKLEVLPLWLQGSANTLQMLVIMDCRNFKALPEWLPSPNSLQTLHIVGCHKLSSLPIGMDCLAAVGELCVQDCLELSRKCKQEDWLKIAHIPKVRLG